MNEELVEISEEQVNITEEAPKVPVCPLCVSVLSSAEYGYKYSRLNPDTRWFWCSNCEAHLGYHRMKRSWKIDPSDFDQVLLEGKGRQS